MDEVCKSSILCLGKNSFKAFVTVLPSARRSAINVGASHSMISRSAADSVAAFDVVRFFRCGLLGFLGATTHSNLDSRFHVSGKWLLFVLAVRAGAHHPDGHRDPRFRFGQQTTFQKPSRTEICRVRRRLASYTRWSLRLDSFQRRVRRRQRLWPDTCRVCRRGAGRPISL